MNAARQERLEQWTERLERWAASGLSGAAWCRAEGVVYAQFAYWRRRLRPAAAEPADEFVALTAPADAAESGVWLRVGEIEIVVARQFDAGCLVRTVQALQRRSC